MAEPRDTEITLGTGKLLGIFLVLVAICGVFFTMGYLLGRGSNATGASTTIVSTVPASGGNTANKPSANGNKAPESAGCSAGSSNCVAASYAPDSKPQTAVSISSVAKPPDASSTTTDGGPEIKAVASGSYMVQVAAVSKQEDADMLVNALRKKQYPVFVVANSPSDAFYHVQVGPFSDAKDAEAMRSRLAADGYNAIVKK